MREAPAEKAAVQVALQLQSADPNVTVTLGPSGWWRCEPAAGVVPSSVYLSGKFLACHICDEATPPN